MRTDAKPWAIICGTYTNEYSIVDSLRELNWPGPIVSIKANDEGTVFTELLSPQVQVWQLSLEAPQDLFPTLCARLPVVDEKFVFFVDERFHAAFLATRETARQMNYHFLVGSETHLDTILDRYAFYDLIEKQKLAQVPRTISSDVDPWEVFGGRFFVRVKRSWRGLTKLSRLKMVHSRSELQAIEEGLRREGLGPMDWCYQEVLSVAPRHNVSICGWHAATYRRYFATRKILQHPPRVGNGDVCEVIAAPEDLVASTWGILDALDYEGPFEMEFVFDQKSKTYRVIELNPRFWMQHGLIEAITGHELIQLYIGEDLARNATPEHPEMLYWVNTVYAVWRLLRADVRMLPYCRSKRAVFVPPYRLALRWIPRYILNMMRTAAARR